MTGFFPERPVQNLRRLDFLITVFLIDAAHVLFNLLPDCPAFCMPEYQARRFILEMEQVQRTPQTAMIAFLSLFKHMKIGVLIFFLAHAVP